MSRRCIFCNEKLEVFKTVKDTQSDGWTKTIFYQSFWYCDNDKCKNHGNLTVAYEDKLKEES